MSISQLIINIILGLLALYGAILSTYIHIKETNYRSKVTLKFGITIEIEPKRTLLLSIFNIGIRPISLRLPYGFELPDKSDLAFINPPLNIKFPYLLEKGKSLKITFKPTEIAKQLKEKNYKGIIKLKGMYIDELDNTYKSKPINFNIDKILQIGDSIK